MNKLMPYCNLIKKNTLILIFIALFTVIINDGKEILFGFKHSLVENGYLIFTSQIYGATAVLMFIYGVLLSYKQFNIAMNIRADRKSYIKTSLIAMLVLSLFFAILTIITSEILGFIIEIISTKKVIIRGDFSNVSILDFINGMLPSENQMSFSYGFSESDNTIMIYIRNLSLHLLNLLTVSSIGYLFGGLLYRLRKRTSVIIFLGIPAIVITLGVTWAISNPDVIVNYVAPALMELVFFIADMYILISIKLIIMTISIISSILLLKNAPIKEYAHDLI